jgi:hypothetical protein
MNINEFVYIVETITHRTQICPDIVTTLSAMQDTDAGAQIFIRRRHLQQRCECSALSFVTKGCSVPYSLITVQISGCQSL